MVDIIKDRLEGVVEPIGLTCDVQRLFDDQRSLCGRLLIPRVQLEHELDKVGMTAVNLSHIPGLLGRQRWESHRLNHRFLESGVREGQFTDLLEELEHTYLGEIINSVIDYHRQQWNTDLQGRHQLVWIQPGRCYPLHRDSHTRHRYHIPLKSDPHCWFLFQKEDHTLCTVMMPADGRIWYLDPMNTQHSVIHLGKQPRLHLILTSEY